jgi:hypothetical protein
VAQQGACLSARSRASGLLRTVHRMRQIDRLCNMAQAASSHFERSDFDEAARRHVVAAWFAYDEEIVRINVAALI